MVSNCPICGKAVEGSEINPNLNKGMSKILTKAGKDTLGSIGATLGSAVGAFIGMQDAGASVGNFLGKSLATGAVKGVAYELRRFAFYCSCCKLQWKSDDKSTAQIIKRHFNSLYESRSKSLPSKPEMNNSLTYGIIFVAFLLCFPYIILSIIWIFNYIIYLCTFTLFEYGLNQITGWISDWFSFTWEFYVYTIGIGIIVYLWRYLQYRKELRNYHEQVHEVTQYNANLREQLNIECNELINKSKTKILIFTD